MGKQIEVEIKGLDKMIEAFRRAPEDTRKAMNTFLRKAIFKILAEARKLTPIDRGFLRGPAMSVNLGELIAVLENTAPYALWVHDGTRPHWPPFSPGRGVEPWAKRHGIPPFLVARSISRKGTKGKPFFDEAITKTQSTVQKIFDRAIANLLNKISR